jgi:hypothetical protein
MGRDNNPYSTRILRVPAYMQPYQYKTGKKSVSPDKSAQVLGMRDGEVLTGFIRGQPASNLEERFALALDQISTLSYEFQPSYIGARNTSGEVKLDFMVYQGGQMFPIQIDGDYVHKTAAQREEDKVKDEQLDQYLSPYLAMPTMRLKEDDISSVAEAKALIERLF